jgi:hypothetical protein
MEFRIITICLILLFCPYRIEAQSTPVSTTRPSLTTIRRIGIFPIRAKPNKEQKKRLQPNPQDLQKYQNLLEQEKTGILRLLPDLGCYEDVNIIKANETCLNYIPDSSFYSFREREHTLEALSDIRLKNGYLISDGILTQGILVKLGDIELNKITPESEGLAFLRSFTPQSSSVEAKNQYFQIIKGIKTGNHEYRKSLPANENTAYALRVVAYRGSVFRRFRGYVFDLLDGDKRIDLTLAFRIIRKEQDGTLTLVWKELERKDSPRIKFPKKPKN